MASYIPLSSEVHRDKRWLRYTSVEFAKHDNVIPIFANEIPEAIHALPIAFVKHRERFELVAVMGLKPGENLFVADSGRWLASYTPVSYRTRPFLMLDAPGNPEQQVLCIEDSRVTEGSLGEPLFNDAGNITAVVNEVLKILTHYNATTQITRTICEALSNCSLIIPWELLIDDGIKETPFNGLYRIDETALNQLPDEEFLKLRKASALSVAYGQLFSMNNMLALSNLLKDREVSKTAKQAPESSGGTFNFAGL